MKKTNYILILSSLLLIFILVGCSDKGKIDISKEKDNIIKQEDMKPSINLVDKDKNHLQDESKMAEEVENISQVNDKSKVLYYCEKDVISRPVNDESLLDVFLKCFDYKGDKVWEHSWKNIRTTELEESSEIIGYDGKFYIAVEGSIYCFDKKDGKILWKNSTDVGGGVLMTPYKENIYFTSYYGNILTCLDKDSGKKIWVVDDEDMYHGSLIVASDDEIMVEYGEEMNIANFNYKDGSIIFNDYGRSTSRLYKFWDRVKASSVLENNHDRYGAQNIIDRYNLDTAWVEGAKGYGIGEWIQIESDIDDDINRIIIDNGYQKTQETYNNNGSLKKFKLDFSNGQYTYYQIDVSKEDSHRIDITFSEYIPTRSIRLTILDTFKGEKYEDTCVTYIEVY